LTDLPVHLLFDVAGYLTATITYLLLRRRYGGLGSPLPAGFGLYYFVCASSGAIAGSVLLGTANLWLSGVDGGLGKSVLGALVGGIVAIEGMKRRYGIRGSTGGLLVPGIAFGIAVGRIGCFTAGLSDYTHGVATSGPLGYDFGDGVLRHPVQLYEAAAMALFGVAYLAMLRRAPATLLPWGFYAFTGFYAAQRLLWEFLKPYADIALALNLFQWLCLALLAYSIWLSRNARSTTMEISG
jgi:prolipoprotein diacylglyceryltransferase